MLKRIFLSLSFFVICESQSLWAADSKEPEITPLVEEGWRYQNGLSLRVVVGEDDSTRDFNFQPLHSAMALTVEASRQTSNDFESTKGDKVLSVFRFTPVLMTDSGVQTGHTISLPSALFDDKPVYSLLSPFISTQETVFVSGFYDVDGTKGAISKFVTTKDSTSVFHDPSKKSEKLFVMLPPVHPEKPHSAGQAGKYDLAIRFAQRNYIDPLFFERNIHFRYPDDPRDTIFSRGKYDPIREIHGKSKELVEQRKQVIAEDFERLRQIALSGDVVEALKGFEELKKGRYKFHSVAGANSYTCAEQSGLDYIADARVFRYIQENLEIKTDRVLGLIVHLHCSHTPCSSCATAVARECEPKGLFSELACGKPVKVICSCSNHYDRPGAMIPYENTTWLEGLTKKEEVLFHLDPKRSTAGANLPYPVVLFKFEHRSSSFEVDHKKYGFFGIR